MGNLRGPSGGSVAGFLGDGIGKGGSALKEVGQEAREELEQLYKCKVYLELFVKVEPKWTESMRGLRKVGYE